jgi:hypothetical protein
MSLALIERYVKMRLCRLKIKRLCILNLDSYTLAFEAEIQVDFSFF